MMQQSITSRTTSLWRCVLGMVSGLVKEITMVDFNTAFVAGLTDDKCDPFLGELVKGHLIRMGLETLYTPPSLTAEPDSAPVYAPKQAVEALKEGIYQAYKNLGLDVENDPSIKDTPSRFAKMFVGELTKGLNYDFFPKCTAVPNGNVLAGSAPPTQSNIGGPEQLHALGAYNQMVLVESIRTTSLCEHHLQTIDGFTHIAYIPGPTVLGLSKFARVTEFFAAR